jgi:hypothetical protein
LLSQEVALPIHQFSVSFEHRINSLGQVISFVGQVGTSRCDVHARVEQRNYKKRFTSRPYLLSQEVALPIRPFSVTVRQFFGGVLKIVRTVRVNLFALLERPQN